MRRSRDPERARRSANARGRLQTNPTARANAKRSLAAAKELLEAQLDRLKQAETMVAQYDESRHLQKLDGIDMHSPEDSAAPIIRMLTMLRNRDMLLCYLRHRLTQIEAARWYVAGKLPDEALELLGASAHFSSGAKEAVAAFCGGRGTPSPAVALAPVLPDR